MCGHFGVAGNITYKEEKIFKQGLIVDALRGEHSTGVLAVYKGELEPVISKQVGSPYELFNDKRFDNSLRPSKRALIGHNRYATMGSVSKHNAHPFQFDHIYGAHNGTLRGWNNLEGYKDYDVDSKALYNHISIHGVEDAISNTMGAWALVWWDDKTEELNFLRNDQRTLYITVSDDANLIYWASEWEMLQLILNRNGVKYGEINLLEVDSWMRIPISEEGELGKPKVKKVAAKKIPVSTNTNTYNGGNPSSAAATSSTNNQVTYTPKKYDFDHKIIRDNVLMEVGRKQLDKRRAAYVSVIDAENPSVKIRLYLKHGDEFQWKEDFILVGRIGSYAVDEEGYFKAVHSTVRRGTTDEQILFDDIMGAYDVADSKTHIETFQDHKGVFLTKEEWEKKFPRCAWCDIDLFAEDKNHVTSDGDAVCPDCSENSEIRVYL